MCENRRPVVFLDFDGTISSVDVIDAILERHASREWLRIEEDWRAGRIGSRQCLAEQMALVCATPAAMHELLDDVGMDAGFVPLLDACASPRIPVHIVSDGFDYCIRRILSRLPEHLGHLTRGITVACSHLEPAADGRWRTAFPFYPDECVHRCATCKPAVMGAFAPSTALSVYVGDGLSDQYAAAEADVVFAKKSLARHCAAQGVAYRPYDDLADVAEYVRTLMNDRTTRKARRTAAARA
jgi:2,3-diketo-5-methylthio-1-phosphopentane phosphatase